MAQKSSKGTEPNFFFFQKPRNYNERKGAQGCTTRHNTNASRQLPLFGMIHVGTSSVLASFEQPDRRVWRTKNILLYTKAQ